MNTSRINRELVAILFTILFILIAGGILWFVYIKMDISDADAPIVALLLLPVIVYLIFSGRIAELKAPGVLEARFTKFAEQRIDPTSTPIDESVQEMSLVEKGRLQFLRNKLKTIDTTKPLNLLLKVGLTTFDRTTLLQYLVTMGQSKNFKFVMVINSAGQLISYTTHWNLSEILRDEERGDQFVQMLNAASFDEIQKDPIMITETLPTSSSNLEALQKMAANRIEALVVTDKAGKPQGIVERDQIVPQLLVALSRST